MINIKIHVINRTFGPNSGQPKNLVVFQVHDSTINGNRIQIVSALNLFTVDLLHSYCFKH